MSRDDQSDRPRTRKERMALPRTEMPARDPAERAHGFDEVNLGYTAQLAIIEAERCLNCDAQTVFEAGNCIECDACADICPTSCINFTQNGPEDELRARLTVPAENMDQDIYVSQTLQTGRVLVKDEDMCLHCGLCAERCPTAAWDMQMFFYNVTKASPNMVKVL